MAENALEVLGTQPDERIRFDTASLEGEIQIALLNASAFNEICENGGYHDAVNAYETVLSVLESAITQTKRLRGHMHKWNKDQYCVICGADGQA